MKTLISYSSRFSTDDLVEDLVSGLAFPAADPPKALILFAAPDHPHAEILARLHERLPNTMVVGTSSAGEFAGPAFGSGMASAFAISGSDVSVSAVLVKDFSQARRRRGDAAFESPESVWT